jgi:hypothetical protein
MIELNFTEPKMVEDGELHLFVQVSSIAIQNKRKKATMSILNSNDSDTAAGIFGSM